MRARHTFPIAALVALTGCATTSDPSKEVAHATSSSSSTQSAGGGSGAGGTAAPLVAQVSSPAAANPPGSGPGGGGGAGSGGGGGSGTAPAQTPEEQRAELEHRFDDSLGSFDATLKKEQEQLAKEHDAAVAAGGGGSSDGAAAGTAHAGSAGTEGPRSGRGRHGSRPADHSGDLHSTKQDGVNAGGYSGNGASAREIPDGSDDDIVARRLRKAAEQETDPELKEKLWQEYVQYKKNAQAK
jgi:hypothetical protein